MNEELLSGGNVAPVVRVGNTVRRASGPWTPAVHALLRHLEASGFDAAPRVLGFDEQGREILSLLPGATVGDCAPWPAWAWSDDSLVQAIELLRRYHDAVRPFRPEALTWRFSDAVLHADEIVCHNDWAPYNMVHRAGRIAGVIDWDVAAPGRPVWDLAFAAWSWVPLNAPNERAAIGAPDDVPRRLRLLCDTYGLADAAGFTALVAARAHASIEGIEAAAARDPALAGLIGGGHVERMRRDLSYIGAHAHDWQRALTG